MFVLTNETELPRCIANVVQQLGNHVSWRAKWRKRNKSHPKKEKTKQKTSHGLWVWSCFVYVFAIVDRNVFSDNISLKHKNNAVWLFWCGFKRWKVPPTNTMQFWFQKVSVPPRIFGTADFCNSKGKNNILHSRTTQVLSPFCSNINILALLCPKKLFQCHCVLQGNTAVFVRTILNFPVLLCVR